MLARRSRAGSLTITDPAGRKPPKSDRRLALWAHLADLDVIAGANLAEEHERPPSSRPRHRLSGRKSRNRQALSRRCRASPFTRQTRIGSAGQIGISVGPQTRLNRSSSRPVPAPPLIAEATQPSSGHRDRILELDEAAVRMRHRGLAGDDHVGLKRNVQHRSLNRFVRFSIACRSIIPRPVSGDYSQTRAARIRCAKGFLIRTSARNQIGAGTSNASPYSARRTKT